MDEERERFYSRLASIEGVRPMPSIGEWILLKVDNPSELARRINRRMDSGVVHVPRNLPGAVRIEVRDPKANELLFFALRDLSQKKARQRFYQELRKESIKT